MQELIQQVVDRAGISEELATAAVAAVMDYIKQHAPAPISAQFEQYLSGDAAASVVGAAKGAIGGIFGKREGD